MRKFLSIRKLSSVSNLGQPAQDQSAKTEEASPSNKTTNNNTSKSSTRFTLDLISSINARNKLGETVLIIAVREGNYELAQNIIEMGKHKINLDLADDQGNTALHFAVKNASNLTQLLIDKGAKIDIQNNLGETPLHIALKGSIEHVEKLDLSLTSNKSGGTPLHSTVYDNSLLNPQIIKLLLDAKADFNARNQEGETPFFLLLAHPDVSKLDKLFDEIFKSANLLSITNNKKTVFHAASANKKIPVEMFITMLAKAGSLTDKSGVALLNSTDSVGTPLYYAISTGQEHIASLILACDVTDPNIYNKQKGSPLHAAVKKNASSVFIMDLLKKGVDINATDKDLHTPFFYAAKNGDLDLMALLYAKTDKSSFSDKEFEPVMRELLLNNKIEALIKLIDYGFNPDFDMYPSKKATGSISKASSIKWKNDNDIENMDGINPGDTLLHYAVNRGHINPALEKLAIDCLQAKPGMVNSPNAEGQTPALKVHSSNMRHILLAYGSPINAATHCPNTTDRENTLLMRGATLGITSFNEIGRYFTDINFEPPTNQLEIKETIAPETEKQMQMPAIVAANLLFIQGNTIAASSIGSSPSTAVATATVVNEEQDESFASYAYSS